MLIIISLYIISFLIFLTGLLRYFKDCENSDNLKISVIAAAKNEAPVIRNFISSLQHTGYPGDNYELIIVDDSSTDDTYTAAEEMIKGQKNINIIKADNKSLRGKRGALLKGIELSRFPYIVISDADCIISSGWLKCFSAAFEDGYEFVFGPSPFLQEQNLINNISCMENLKNQALSFSLAVLGLPYTATARSIGFTKDAFLRMGGYSRTQDSLSGDDDLLLREAVRHKLRIKAFYDSEAFVYSRTKKTLGEYLDQKARHTQTSFHYFLKNKFILGLWHILNLFMLFSPLLIFFNFSFIWMFIMKMTSDTIMLSSVQKKFGYRFSIFQIFYLNILYELFIVINFFNAMFRRTEWK